MQTIDYRQGRYSDQDDITHIWECTIGGQVAGALYVTLDTQEVANIEVKKDFQRQGIATQLWEKASESMTVYHAYAAHRTPEGHAFAEAVGGEEIEECDIEVCYCSELDH